MGIAMDAANALEAAIDAKIAKAAPKRTRATGTVTRVDADGTSYVKLDGSDYETPVARTAAALNQGQQVGGTVTNGELVIDGNFSAPATDDAKALEAYELADGADAKAVKAGKIAADAAKVADEAGKVAEATEQHFWHDTNGVHVTEAEGDATTEHNILMNSLGILLRKALNNLVSITASAISFFDGSGNTAQHVTASFGGSGANLYAGGSLRQKTDTDGSHYYASDGTTEVLKIGVDTTGSPKALLDFLGDNRILSDELGVSIETNASGSWAHRTSVEMTASGTSFDSEHIIDSYGRISMLTKRLSDDTYTGIEVDGTGLQNRFYGSNTVFDATQMFGDATLRDCNAIIRNEAIRFDRDGANPSAAIYGKDYRITDKDGERVAFMRANRLADGTMQMQLNVCNENTSGTEVTNYLILGVNRSGVRTVQFAESAPWRTALGLDKLVKVVSATSSEIPISAGGNHSFAPTLTIPSGYTLVGSLGCKYTANNANLSTAACYKYSSTQIAAVVVNHGSSARSVAVTTYGLCVKTAFVG